MNRKILLISIPTLFTTLFFILFQQTIASPKSSIVVNSTADTQSNDGECTLREAVINANNDNQSGSTDCAAGNGADEITFSLATPATIAINSQLPDVSAGSMLTIRGPGADQSALILDGGGNSRVFSVLSGASLTLDTLTVMNGSSGDGGGLYNNGGTVNISDCTFANNAALNLGGGIFNDTEGTITVTNSILNGNTAAVGGGLLNNMNGIIIIENTDITNNTAPNYGGGVYSSGMLTVTNSTFSNNVTDDVGGGIHISALGTAYIAASDFSMNEAYFGGGLYNYGTTTILGSVFSDNNASYGGGLDNDGTTTIGLTSFLTNYASVDGGGFRNNNGTVTIADTTFAGNATQGNGGGLNNYGGDILITNSTFSDNTATSGGGVENGHEGQMIIINSTISHNSGSGGGLRIGGGTVELKNSLIANSINEADCLISGGSLANGDGNLIEDGSCGFPTGGDPLLAQLANNGGSTLTHALLPGSPAIDNANGNNCTSVDQRGVTRPQQNGCDIGAFELDVTYTTATELNSHIPNPSIVNKPVSVSFSVTSASGNPVGDVTVSDGVNSCVGSVAQGSCLLILTTQGTHILTATYNGLAGFSSSTSSEVTHVVDGINLYLPLLLRPIPCLPASSPETEPNDNSANATGPLCLNQDYHGLADNGEGNWDYYFFTLPSAGTFTIDITNHPLASVNGAQVLLYFQSVSTGNLVGGPDLLPPYQITYTGAAGTYYIVLFNDISKCDQVDCSQSYIVRVSSISP